MGDEKGTGSQRVGVRISGSTVHAQNIAGRDIHVVAEISSSELSQVFQPVMEAIRSASVEKQPEAVEKLEALKQEVIKGKHANHDLMRKLADEIVSLVPEALKSMAKAFGKPLLAGVSGPVTQFLLNKMLG